MDILMLGSGGREHALIKKLKESPKAGKIYCAPGNGGISKDAECVNISVMDKESIIAFAKEKNIDLVLLHLTTRLRQVLLMPLTMQESELSVLLQRLLKSRAVRFSLRTL